MAILKNNGEELVRLAIEVPESTNQHPITKIISIRSNGWILKKYKHTDYTTSWKRDCKIKYDLSLLPKVIERMANNGWTILACFLDDSNTDRDYYSNGCDFRYMDGD